MVHHVHTEEEYNKLKDTKDKLVVVDFSATWCGPCKMIAPTFEEFSKTYSDVVFIHIDVDELESIPDNSDVSGIPTFKFFKNGQLLHKFSGANKDALETAIKKHK